MGFITDGSVLHCGCGSAKLPSWLQHGIEVRLDVDDTYAPDVVADMITLGAIGPFDVVYSSHALEHLHPYDVFTALFEFHRVLVNDGCVMVFVPDLEGVEPTAETLFDSPAGPISGLDLIYGFRQVTRDRPYMRHLSGFTEKTLRKALEAAGFKRISVRRIGNYELMGVAIK